jgi:membrane protease YdiL (CAAX protease family)
MNSNDEKINSSEPVLKPESQTNEQARAALNAADNNVAPTPGPWGSPAGTENFRPLDRLLPEDLGVPWGWWDLGLLVVIAIAGLVVFWAFLGMGFYMAGITKEQFQHSVAYQGRFAIIAMVFLSLLLLSYLAAQMRLRFRSPILRTLRWRPLETTGPVKPAVAYLGFILGGFLLSILVALVSSAFSPKNKMPIEQYFQDRHTALLLLIMSVTLAPLFEETIFRAYLYPVVARTFGLVPGVLFTGLLFGLMHSSQLGGNLPQVALIVVVGIVFTAARAKTGNVLPGYLLHVSYNSFIAIAFLVASHGLRQMPPA